jgi:hypothetical protein
MQWAQGALSPYVKWPGHKSDHAPPSGAEVKNEWSNISVISIVNYIKTSGRKWITLV